MIKKALYFSTWGPWGGPDVDNNHPGYQHPRKYSEWFKSKGFDSIFIGAPLFDCIYLLFKFESQDRMNEFLKILPIEIKNEMFIECPSIYENIWGDNISAIQPTIDGYEVVRNKEIDLTHTTIGFSNQEDKVTYKNIDFQIDGNELSKKE